MEKQSFHIAIIGKGNVASHLIKWFESACSTISSIYAREQSDCFPDIKRKINLDYQDEKCDFIIIASNDDAISSIASKIQNPGKAIILHTSGTINLETLNLPHLSGHGVLYPLQTLQKGRGISLEEVPFLIEGNNSTTISKIESLCKSSLIKYQYSDSPKRLKYHLSAVMCANFSNHLIHLAEKQLEGTDLDIRLLEPLLKETMAKAFSNGAFNSQTGPAKRNDQETIKKHLELIANEEHQKIYQLISESIISEHHKKS